MLQNHAAVSEPSIKKPPHASSRGKAMKDRQGINYTSTLLLLSLAEMLVSSLLLTYLNMGNWSAVLAEDSEGYILVARFFSGHNAPAPSLPLLRYRLFSPLVPCLASLLARIMPLEHAFLMLNCFFWLSSVYLVYRFSAVLLNRTLGYYCALIFTTSLPLIVWGLPVMVDMAAFFMAVLNCFIITHPSQSRAVRMLVALTLPLAVLTKPNLISLVIFIAFYSGLRKEYGSMAAVGAVTLMLVGGVYLSLGLTIQDFLALGYLRHRGFVYVVNALIFCFHWGIPLALWGFYAERDNRAFYLTYLVSTFGCYLAFVHNPRLLFITFPAVLPLIVRGIALCSERFAGQWHLTPRQLLTTLTAGFMLTSNLLAAFYLYITRVLQYRSIETLGDLLR